MPKITYYPEGFDPALGTKLTSPRSLTCSWARLFWSAITVGRASWNKVIQYGMYSAFEIIYRGSMLAANLMESPSRKLEQTVAYTDLDPSEKSAVSYFLGLTVAKLLAQKLLGVSYLMHLDVYKDILNLPTNGRSRPDLVGTDKSLRWIVVEAKGRTNGIKSVDKAAAKGQVEQLTSIGGIAPHLGTGVISYFNSGKKLEVFLKDPPIGNESGYDLPLNPGTFFHDYYRMFVDLIDSAYGDKTFLELSERTYIAKYITEVDVWVGIDEAVYNLMTRYSADLEHLSKLPLTLPETPQPLARLDRRPSGSDKNDENNNEDENSLTLVGEDGIYVRLGSTWGSRHKQNERKPESLFLFDDRHT